MTTSLLTEADVSGKQFQLVRFREGNDGHCATGARILLALG